jgi:hypothetical protein
MGIGRKIGRGFLKLAEQGQKMDEGLNKLLGEDRTRPGDGFSKDNTRSNLPSMKEKDNDKVGDILADENNKDRRFY